MTIPRNLSFLAQGASATGVLSVPYGGTGLITLTAGYIPYGNGTGAFSSTNLFNFDGTNLGVGTTSPSTFGKIVAYNGGIVSASTTGTTTAKFEVFSNGQTTNQVTLSQGFGGTDNIGYLYNRANADFVFGTNNTERMRIAAGGNIGVGVSPASSASFPLFIGKDQSAGTFLGVSNYQNNAAAQAGIDIEAYGGLWRMYTPQSSTNSNPLIFSWLGTTEYMRIHASGGVSIGNTTDPGAGNLRFSTAGTNGIYFGSSARLDDYETGTWTPVVTASTGSITSYTASGTYTKVGRLVVATFTYNITNNGTGAGLILVTAPFTAGSDALYPTGSAAEVAIAGWGGYCIIAQSTASIGVQQYNGAYAGLTGVIVRGTISYQV